uniref:SUZ domain-containing protein n=1 Tax=Opuntia streptacantha TaxID=393608 RepID=A0A7C9E7S6_OPUST
MEGSAIEDSGAPESWEVADVEETMKRLMLSHAKDSATSSSSGNMSAGPDDLTSDSARCPTEKAGCVGLSEDAINQVDQFLREALQNPRERLSILRMEQDVIKFIQDPTRQQLEFQQLPTSYLRLAAHRVAQHYFLQSMVLLDNSLPDGSGSRIIVRKTSADCRLPRIRLADIPVYLPQDDSGVIKVAIKQRPQKHSPMVSGTHANCANENHSKTVEERKEEYNRARARIFNSGPHSNPSAAKPEIQPKKADKLQVGSAGLTKVDEISVPGSSGLSGGRSLVDSATGSNRSARSREKDPISRYRPTNRVAIFRDREIDRKDPDYDRSYDRYMQRFDPGFGFSAGPYTVQPMYTPAINYNTEFPQLGSSHRPQVSVEPPRPLPQPMPGPWTPPSNPATLGYGHPDTMVTAFSPSHVNAHSTTAIYLHATQYPCQRPGMPFVHPHEHQTFLQSQQQQHDASLGLARPR